MKDVTPFTGGVALVVLVGVVVNRIPLGLTNSLWFVAGAGSLVS